jgi:N-acetylmuramoyl-L-alanine amidase
MMNRTIYLLFAFCFSAILFSFTRHDSSTPPKASIRTLIIDAGHGGIDPGARGSYSNEADVSLKVALKLGKLIQNEYPDLKIIFTRTADVTPGNKRSIPEANRWRATMANESGGDLYIAIHCNSAPSIRHREVTGYRNGTVYVGKGKKRKKVTRKIPQYRHWTTPNPAHGTETYIWALDKNDAKVNSMNQIEYYGEIDSTDTEGPLKLPDPSDPAEKARMLIYAQHYFRKSYDLADMIEKQFVSRGRFSRGVKQRNDKGIWVLQATGMPSILVEIGFISDKEDEEYINSDKGQEEISEDILNAFKSYKEKLESKSISTSP